MTIFELDTMRSDMDKVIVERPRINSRAKSRKKGYRKYIASTPIDELPLREPMLGRWCGREKWLNEHLGPMRKFLRSNVGRPWNKIHQELCEHISFDNAVQSHVLDHVFDFVNDQVNVINATLVYGKWRWSGGQRVLRVGEMYICPRSRILKVVKPPKSKPEVRYFEKSDSIRYLKKNGLWWEVRLCPIPEEPGETWDVWMERSVAELLSRGAFAPYGKKRFANSKRQLSGSEAVRLRKEIRKRNR